MLIAVDVGLLFQFVPALAAKHPDIFHGITVRRTHRECPMYMATLVNSFAADFAAVLCHLQPEIALRAAETIAFSVLVDYFKRLSAYPDIAAK